MRGQRRLGSEDPSASENRDLGVVWGWNERVDVGEAEEGRPPGRGPRSLVDGEGYGSGEVNSGA